jgi:hypothetical protein
MAFLICLGPTASEALTQSDSQQEWISRSSQSKKKPKHKKHHKKHHRHHHASSALPATAFTGSFELQLGKTSQG